MLNALTVDVEDYFHVTAFEKYVDRDSWDACPLRVETNTKKTLDLLDEYSIKATFFVLGWVAEKCPALVQEIHGRGHEIACHGYGHELVYRIGPDRFRQDLRKARNILEAIISDKVHGYRAPSYSITKDSLWAFDTLIEEGFSYDSSIFPVLHDIYGIPGARRFPYEVMTENGTIREFPLSTIEIAGYRLPVAGGGYLRLYPLWLTQKAICHINNIEKQPAIVYFHPWEIDPEQPRIKASLKSRFRHYLNLGRTETRLRNLLKGLKFGTMADLIGTCPSQEIRTIAQNIPAS